MIPGEYNSRNRKNKLKYFDEVPIGNSKGNLIERR
jgi:hypothetical protein